MNSKQTTSNINSVRQSTSPATLFTTPTNKTSHSDLKKKNQLLTDENMRLKEIVVNLNLELHSYKNKTTTMESSSSGSDVHQQSNHFLDEHKMLKIDQCASMSKNKVVGKLVQSILTTLYEPISLKNRSVTGAISQNPK